MFLTATSITRFHRANRATAAPTTSAGDARPGPPARRSRRLGRARRRWSQAAAGGVLEATAPGRAITVRLIHPRQSHPAAPSFPSLLLQNTSYNGPWMVLSSSTCTTTAAPSRRPRETPGRWRQTVPTLARSSADSELSPNARQARPG